MADEESSYDFMTKNLKHGDEVAEGSKCQGDQTYYAASFPFWFPRISGGDPTPTTIFDVPGKHITADETFHGQGKCVVYQLCHNNQYATEKFESNQLEPRVIHLDSSCKLESQVRDECTLTPKAGTDEEMCWKLNSRLRIAEDALEAVEEYDRKQNTFYQEKQALDLSLPTPYDPYDASACPASLRCQLIYECCSDYQETFQVKCSCAIQCLLARNCKYAQVDFEETKSRLKEMNIGPIDNVAREKQKRKKAVDEAKQAWTAERTQKCDTVFARMWSAFADCVKEGYEASCDKECVSFRNGSGVIEGFNPDGIMKVGVKASYSPPRSWMLAPWRDNARQYNSWNASKLSWNEATDSSESDTTRTDLFKGRQRYTQTILKQGKMTYSESGIFGTSWPEACFVLLSGDAIHSAMMLGFKANECAAADLANATLTKSVALWNLNNFGNITTGGNHDECFAIFWPQGGFTRLDVCVADGENPSAAEWKKVIQESIGMLPS